MSTYYKAKIARIYLKLFSIIKKSKLYSGSTICLTSEAFLIYKCHFFYRLEQPEPALLQNLVLTPLSLQEAAAVEQDATAIEQDITTAEQDITAAEQDITAAKQDTTAAE